MDVSRARVRFRLLATDEGGRHRPIDRDYRCQWRSSRKPAWNDAAVEVDAPVPPGEETIAWLVFAVPSLWRDAVLVGDRLEGAEGERLVATADVLTIEST